MKQLLIEASANTLAAILGPPIANQQYYKGYPSLLIKEQHVKPSFDLSSSKMEFILVGNIAKGWELIQPLLVTLEQDEDGYYILSDDIFQLYGEGETELIARLDYITTLIDYYYLLESKADEGDPPSQNLPQKLQKYLRSVKP
jgi:hypothetical protein